jgi:hypothetical protein
MVVPIMLQNRLMIRQLCFKTQNTLKDMAEMETIELLQVPFQKL